MGRLYQIIGSLFVELEVRHTRILGRIRCGSDMLDSYLETRTAAAPADVKMHTHVQPLELG